jgi:hypothetical protein
LTSDDIICSHFISTQFKTADVRGNDVRKGCRDKPSLELAAQQRSGLWCELMLHHNQWLCNLLTGQYGRYDAKYGLPTQGRGSDSRVPTLVRHAVRAPQPVLIVSWGTVGQDRVRKHLSGTSSITLTHEKCAHPHCEVPMIFSGFTTWGSGRACLSQPDPKQDAPKYGQAVFVEYYTAGKVPGQQKTSQPSVLLVSSSDPP